MSIYCTALYHKARGLYSENIYLIVGRVIPVVNIRILLHRTRPTARLTDKVCQHKDVALVVQGKVLVRAEEHMTVLTV